jgi:hypothetical protein
MLEGTIGLNVKGQLKRKIIQALHKPPLTETLIHAVSVRAVFDA